MDSCSGTITVEYYDGTSDFSSSDDSQCPIPRDSSSTSTPTSSSCSPNVRDSISCKTYDFKHVGSESENELGVKGVEHLFPEMAREAMKSHYIITHEERKQALVHPKASFPRCPRGDIPEQYARRKHPGPFLTCSFSHSHECGDDFIKIPIPTKPTPEYDTFTRPQHLKEKKAKFFKQCKHCETIGFTHHRNPARHYEDYLNNVTYKQHNDQSKVWQQHAVDLMFMLGEKSVDSNISEQCKDYKPSEPIAKASGYSRTPRRMHAAITRKKIPIGRPLRRPLHKATTPKVASLTNQTRATSGIPGKQQALYQANRRQYSLDKSDSDNYLSCQPYPTAKSSANDQRKTTDKHWQSIRRRSASNEINIDGRRRSELHQRLTASATRLINSQVSSKKVSKRFVKKPAPPKEVKYIQRGKPNISAKFLRARSKIKSVQNTPRRSHVVSPAISGGKGRSSISRKTFRKKNEQRSGRAFGKSHMQHQTNDLNLKDNSSEDDGSYAQYRDKNGEFDVEKYRQSILKMLSKNMENSTAAMAKKKKSKRFTGINQTNFVTLPKIKNVYRNVKPRITSNIPKGKRRKTKKTKCDSEIDGQVLSDASVKCWNDDSLANSSFSQ